MPATTKPMCKVIVTADGERGPGTDVCAWAMRSRPPSLTRCANRDLGLGLPQNATRPHAMRQRRRDGALFARQPCRLVIVGAIDWVNRLVRKGGLEPPRPFGHWILSPARLPIPPLSRGVTATVACTTRIAAGHGGYGSQASTPATRMKDGRSRPGWIVRSRGAEPCDPYRRVLGGDGATQIGGRQAPGPCRRQDSTALARIERVVGALEEVVQRWAIRRFQDGEAAAE